MQIASLVWKGITVVPARLVKHGARTTWLWLYEKILRLSHGMSPAETSMVTDRLWVGGQHYTRGLNRMKQAGIGATLSLREEADDVTAGVALSLHLCLPTPDDGAPTVEQLREGVAFIRNALAAGSGVYIHCAQGVGRAPTMAAAYLVSEGRSPREAWEIIRTARPFITPTPIQLQRLDEWAKQTHTESVNNGLG